MGIFVAKQLEGKPMSAQPEPDQEILAITTVYAALKDLDAAAQRRVIDYVLKKLNLTLDVSKREEEQPLNETPTLSPDTSHAGKSETYKVSAGDECASISPVAQRWMQRNGLRAEQLSAIFSLGGDEIDLVANKVPGKSSRARMRNVFLLKGVAAYLGSGAARFPHDKVKETCVHYDAYDRPNFSKNLKEFASEVSGSKESGYTLTARGLTSAASVVKEMLGLKQ